MTTTGKSLKDPRVQMDMDDLAEARHIDMPQVASARGDGGTFFLGAVIAIGLGILTFLQLSATRQPDPQSDPAGVTAAVMPTAVIPPPAPPAPPPVPPQPIAPPTVEPAKPPIRSERLRAPALVIDLGTSVRGTAAEQGSTPGEGLGVNEVFAARIGSATTPATRATRIEDPSIIVPEGTIISGVLETAINSDLPGYVRAIVGQDVRSFDSSRVLIPRGSRLIGQYRSGLAIGESRAFVVWSRILRPDGVSIQLASPATDTLGRAGLTGIVDRHFLQRFGSAILLSVIGGGIDALDDNDNEIVIGSADQAQNVAATALSKSIDIPPTVKVAQGTAIRIFTAKDLYFPQDSDPLVKP